MADFSPTHTPSYMPAPRCSANWPYTFGLMVGPGRSAWMVTATWTALAGWAARATTEPEMLAAAATTRASKRLRLRLSIIAPFIEFTQTKIMLAARQLAAQGNIDSYFAIAISAGAAV